MKDFWEKWEYGRWRQDTAVAMLTESSRCFWFEALNCMMEQQTYKITGTIEQLAFATRCRVSVVEQALAEIQDRQVAEVHEQNGSKTLVSRMRQRLHEISDLRREAATQSRSKTQAKREQTPQQTSNSNSICSSVPVVETDTERPTEAEFVEYCKSLLILPAEAIDLYGKAAQRGWNDGGDVPIRDWRRYCGRMAKYIIQRRNEDKQGKPQPAQPGGRREAWKVEKDIEAVRTLMKRLAADMPFGNSPQAEADKAKWLQSAKGDEYRRLKDRKKQLEQEMANAV